jgi:hypothetical protein
MVEAGLVPELGKGAPNPDGAATWRTTTRSKPLDADGDNVYGTAAGTASARGYGYLLVDDPGLPPGTSVADLESGLLVAGTEHNLLQVETGNNMPANGCRLGVPPIITMEIRSCRQSST